MLGNARSTRGRFVHAVVDRQYFCRHTHLLGRTGLRIWEVLCFHTNSGRTPKEFLLLRAPSNLRNVVRGSGVCDSPSRRAALVLLLFFHSSIGTSNSDNRKTL